ncbi:MAG: hypothetical protein GY772_20340 [bacterium]|nr:hypothetical protein [bacterium]
MSTRVHSPSDLPDCPIFVVARDSFMSGWGPGEHGSYVILACEDLTEAHAVRDYAETRDDMQGVGMIWASQANQWFNVLPDGAHADLMTRDDATAWFPVAS